MILYLPTLAINDTSLNSYSASSELLTAGPEPSMDYPLNNTSNSSQHSWQSWCRL